MINIDMNSKKVWFGVLAAFAAMYAFIFWYWGSAEAPHWLIYVAALYLGLLSTEAFFVGLLMNVADPTRLFSMLNLVILFIVSTITMLLLMFTGVATLVNLLIAEALYLPGIVISIGAVLVFYLMGHNCAKEFFDEFVEHAHPELVNLAVDSYHVSEADLEGARTVSAVAERIAEKDGLQVDGVADDLLKKLSARFYGFDEFDLDDDLVDFGARPPS